MEKKSKTRFTVVSCCIISRARLEGITKPDHPLREGIGLLFISNTEVSLPEHPPSEVSMEQGVGESYFCANALRTDKSSCKA